MARAFLSQLNLYVTSTPYGRAFAALIDRLFVTVQGLSNSSFAFPVIPVSPPDGTSVHTSPPAGGCTTPPLVFLSSIPVPRIIAHPHSTTGDFIFSLTSFSWAVPSAAPRVTEFELCDEDYLVFFFNERGV